MSRKQTLHVDSHLVEKLKAIAAAAEVGERYDVTGLPRLALMALLFPDHAQRCQMTEFRSYDIPRTQAEVDRLRPAALKLIPVLSEGLGLTADEARALFDFDLEDPTSVTAETLYRVSYLIGFLDRLSGYVLQNRLNVSPAKWMHSTESVEWMHGRSPVSYLASEGLPGFARLNDWDHWSQIK